MRAACRAKSRGSASALSKAASASSRRRSTRATASRIAFSPAQSSSEPFCTLARRSRTMHSMSFLRAARSTLARSEGSRMRKRLTSPSSAAASSPMASVITRSICSRLTSRLRAAPRRRRRRDSARRARRLGLGASSAFHTSSSSSRRRVATRASCTALPSSPWRTRRAAWRRTSIFFSRRCSGSSAPSSRGAGCGGSGTMASWLRSMAANPG